MSAGFGTKGSVAAVGEAERPLAIAANRLHTVIGGSYNCYGGSSAARKQGRAESLRALQVLEINDTIISDLAISMHF